MGQVDGRVLVKMFGLVVVGSLGVVGKIKVGPIAEQRALDLPFFSRGEACSVLLDVLLGI